jgi:hypothetical protein
METGYKKIIAIITILLAVLAVITPVLWDVYMRKAALELHHLSSITLLDDPKIEKLEIIYKGQPITNITKLSFLLRNSGQLPILREHIVEPLKISFSGIRKILDVNVSSKIPESLEVHYNIFAKEDYITIDFPLLNPGDFAYFSVLVIGNYSVDFKTSARIVNVKDIDIIRKVESTEKKAFKWSTYIFRIFSIFYFLMAIITGKWIRTEIRVKKVFNSEDFQIQKPSTKDEYEILLKKYFSTRSKKEMADIKNLLSQIEPGANITDGKHQQIVDELHRVANEVSMNWLYLVVCIVATSLFMWWSFVL